MKLSKNFTAAEFACNDGSPTPCEALINLKEVALNLQELRDYLGLPIHVNSGYRSPAYNKRIGGAKFSQHLLGKAADIMVSGKKPAEIYAAIEHLIKEGKMKNGGLGIYPTFVHFDVRDTPARW